MLTEKRQKSAFASIRNASIYPRDASHSATLREHDHGLGGAVRYSGEHKGGHFVHLALPWQSCIRKPPAIRGQVRAPLIHSYTAPCERQRWRY